MKYFKHLPAIGLYVYLSYMSIFIITGGWQFLIKLFFDFGYIRVVINLSIIASSVLIIWIMRTYFKKAYVTFYNSVIHFKKSLGISIATLIIVFLSYLINIYLFSNLGILSITIHPDFWATTNFIVKSMLAGITIAIGEEIVFRGFLFNAIQKKIKKRTMAIIVSSFFFSIIHLHYNSVFEFLTAFWAGIILCILYIKYKSLYPPIFFHFGWNFSYVFFSLIKNTPSIENNPLFRTEFLGFLEKRPELLDLFNLTTVSLLFLIIYFSEKVGKYFKNLGKKPAQVGVRNSKPLY